VPVISIGIDVRNGTIFIRATGSAAVLVMVQGRAVQPGASTKDSPSSLFSPQSGA
jgi:hypothetical protein